MRRGVFPPGVVERPSIAPVRQRVGVTLVGLGTSVKFLIHNNSYANLRRALMERVFNVEGEGGLQPPPQPRPGVFRRLVAAADQLVQILGTRAPVSREEFVASRPSSKKPIYQAGLESLYATPICKRDSRIDGAFVKCEKVNAKKGDPAPRIIQPRTVRYNIEVGRYLSGIEHDVYSALDEMWGGPTVMKGLNADGVGQAIHEAWLEFDEPVGVGLDASRFDQHVSREALQFEHSIYNRVFGSDELARLLRWQEVNIGVGRACDGSIKYIKEGSRMSGDMNTALGNIIIMVLLNWLYIRELGFYARLVNNGDDCVLIFERKYLPLLAGLKDWFLQFGFNIVMEDPVYELERIEFCQCHPVAIDGSYRMVRNLSVALSKDCISRIPRSIKDLRCWMHCVGSSGAALCDGIPVFSAFYRLFLRHGLAGKRWHQVEEMNGFYMLSKGMSYKALQVSHETRASFELAFGVTVGHQLALEEYYDTLAWGPDELPQFIAVDI